MFIYRVFHFCPSTVTDLYSWDRNNFPFGITMEYPSTGIAGGYMTDGALKSAY